MNHFTEVENVEGLVDLCPEKVGVFARKEAGEAERHRASKTYESSLWKTAVFRRPVKHFGDEC